MVGFTGAGATLGAALTGFARSLRNKRQPIAPANTTAIAATATRGRHERRAFGNSSLVSEVGATSVLGEGAAPLPRVHDLVEIDGQSAASWICACCLDQHARCQPSGQ
jgi:hypothetical protein